MKFPSITILFGKDVWILPGIWGPTGPNQSKVFKILKQREIPIAKNSFWKDIWTLSGIDGRIDPNFKKGIVAYNLQGSTGGRISPNF